MGLEATGFSHLTLCCAGCYVILHNLVQLELICHPRSYPRRVFSEAAALGLAGHRARV